jgi:hypothetical protein
MAANQKTNIDPMKKYILGIWFINIIGILLSWDSLAGQSLQFYGEKIEICILGDNALVTGEYYFRNNTSHPIRRTLYYPFVINQNLPWPDSISVYQVSEKKSLTCRKAKEGILFTLQVPADSRVIYKVTYRQQTPNQKMEYILTTTQKWGHPLVFAEYSIILPKEFKLLDISLVPDSSQSIKHKQIIKINRQNYLPTKNLTLYWKSEVLK